MHRKISQKSMEELLRKLVSISSPYFHEDEVMDYVKGWLEERNLPVEVHTYKDSRVTGFEGKNITGVLDGGKPGPVIYLNGHLDTVNICDGWTKDQPLDLFFLLLYRPMAARIPSPCSRD